MTDQTPINHDPMTGIAGNLGENKAARIVGAARLTIPAEPEWVRNHDETENVSGNWDEISDADDATAYFEHDNSAGDGATPWDKPRECTRRVLLGIVLTTERGAEYLNAEQAIERLGWQAVAGMEGEV